MVYYKSPLRYPGGKSRAIEFLKDFFPSAFKEYREPFFGGGSVGLYLAQSHLKKDIQFFANDLNYDLYCFWQGLKTQNEELSKELLRIKQSFKDGRELYESLLERRGSQLSDFQRAVDFFILNRITFSGTVDCGGYSQKAFESRFTQSSIERLRKIKGIVQKFHFSADDYTQALQRPGESVFIFLDPPYWSASQSRLYGKKGNLHRDFDHECLSLKLKAISHPFLLTYDDSQKIRELYKDFYIREWNLQYGMNNFRQKRVGKAQELLISNFKLSILDAQ